LFQLVQPKAPQGFERKSRRWRTIVHCHIPKLQRASQVVSWSLDRRTPKGVQSPEVRPVYPRVV